MFKRQYKRQEGNMLDFLRIFKKNSKNSFSTLSNVDFFNHFKSLVEISANYNYSYVSSEENWSAVYEELDEEISLDEISSAIAKLKQYKNCGENYILKEIFKICKLALLPLFHIMFNNIFECVYLPDAWSKAFIVPLLKKGR